MLFAYNKVMNAWTYAKFHHISIAFLSSVLLRLSTENNFNHRVRLLMQVALFCVFRKTRTTLPTLEPTKSYKPRRNVWQADRQEDRQTYVSFKQHIELKKQQEQEYQDMTTVASCTPVSCCLLNSTEEGNGFGLMACSCLILFVLLSVAGSVLLWFILFGWECWGYETTPYETYRHFSIYGCTWFFSFFFGLP